MQVDYTVQIWREGSQYVAHAMPLDVMSAGNTPQAAREALVEAVELLLATAAEASMLNEVLEESGYRFADGQWISPSWVSVERQSTAIGE